MRYFVDISFNGKNYHGWQIQPDALSIQEVLERTFSTFFRAEIKVAGAGRTDTGVHASQMVAHFDMNTEIEDMNEVIFRLNSFLPKDIAILDIYPVIDEAHARFDAIEREYQYGILFDKDPFRVDVAYQIHQMPDIEIMNQAAQLLLGHQDFQCFSRSNTDVKTYYCDVKEASWEYEDYFLIFTIAADRFLRNMVRAIVGTLLDVGHGKITIEEFQEIIKSKDRTKAGASAPAHGLFLTRVEYPETIYK
ncbi:MAG: tRNA pseudouridine(38-40) synthase TruA [Bacteroidia bacterium]|nr:tRNA pseudouridine(38-40) synthase TruA [Bacteroidia bacterium]NNJ80950.1 tRNA pseudouridine(38-40) synthase TruA [Flavobacteriaceae bacterium]NNK53497.1 tRNA pseudouridine(38-40) synthase TruA [Flavobacteriaceae bacterium]NNM08719.1 tRNA pseudouridine(38-40) synthase TruA [Flavobacteriaceae bacterium]